MTRRNNNSSNNNKCDTRGHLKHTVGVNLDTNGLNTTYLSSGLTTVTNALASVYRYFRFVGIKITLMPVSETHTRVICTYIPSGDSTQASPFDGFSDARKLVVQVPYSTIPQSMQLTRKDLINQTPWFITQEDSLDPNLDAQGALHYEGGASQQVIVVMDIDYEFQYPCLSTNLTTLATQAKIQRTLMEQGRKAPSDLSRIGYGKTI